MSAPISTPTHIWTVVEMDEDGIATAWTSAFRSLDTAAAAVEAHHEQMWTDAEMGDEAPELAILPTSDDECVLDVLDSDVSWRRWVITRAALVD